LLDVAKFRDFVKKEAPRLDKLVDASELIKFAKRTKLYYGVLVLWRVHYEILMKLYPTTFEIAQWHQDEVSGLIKKLGTNWRLLLDQKSRQYFQSAIEWSPEEDSEL
jgi:hypothetical protein